MVNIRKVIVNLIEQNKLHSTKFEKPMRVEVDEPCNTFSIPKCLKKIIFGYLRKNFKIPPNSYVEIDEYTLDWDVEKQDYNIIVWGKSEFVVFTDYSKKEILLDGIIEFTGYPMGSREIFIYAVELK